MDNVEEQADDVYQGILGEIGLEYQEVVPVIKIFCLYHFIIIQGIKKDKIVVKGAQEEEKKQDFDELEARLAALKN